MSWGPNPMALLELMFQQCRELSCSLENGKGCTQSWRSEGLHGHQKVGGRGVSWVGRAGRVSGKKKKGMDLSSTSIHQILCHPFQATLSLFSMETYASGVVGTCSRRPTGYCAAYQEISKQILFFFGSLSNPCTPNWILHSHAHQCWRIGLSRESLNRWDITQAWFDILACSNLLG